MLAVIQQKKEINVLKPLSILDMVAIIQIAKQTIQKYFSRTEVWAEKYEKADANSHIFVG